MAIDERRRLMRLAVSRAALRPYFLASDLAVIQESRGLNARELASWLGCTEDALLHAALSRSPARGPAFRVETEAIADRFGLQGERLAAILRGRDAIGELRTAHAARTGWMAAARDRDDREGGRNEHET
jgi:hypothetical protein